MSEFYAQATQLPKKIVGVVEQMKKKRVKYREVFIALFDYTPAPGRKDCLAFQKDDEFTLKDENGMNQKWILLKHVPTGKKGFVPKNFVARLSDKELLQWCNLDHKREEAVERLRNARYGSGAFIIRSTSLQGGCGCSEALALSIKSMTGNATKILHYSIIRERGEFRLRLEKRDTPDSENKESESEIAFPSLTRLVMCLARFPVGLQQRLTYSVKKDCPIDTWTIDRDEITVDEKKKEDRLGGGNFGEVFKATIDGRVVAVKKLLPVQGMDEKLFIKEAEMARRFTHENIVTTIGVCHAVPYIVTEFLPGGNLKEYVAKNVLSEQENLEIARMIACAMAHLEKHRIVHRDLAARNILVGQSHNVIKLTDFGLARCLLNDKLYYQNSMGIFPLKWTAPEAFVITDKGAFSQVGKSSTASDVWSYAVVLWELYSRGATPYHNMEGLEIFHKLRTGSYRLERPENCPEDAIYPKMLECWSLEPSKRPTFAKLLTFLQECGASEAGSSVQVAE